MSRKTRLLAVFALIAVGVGGWGALQAFSSSSVAAPVKVTFPAGTKISPLQPIGSPAFQSTQLIHTYLQGNYPGLGTSYTAGTFVPVDGVTTVNCNPPNQFHGSCGLEVDQNVQAAALSGADQDAAICVAVDGLFINFCPYVGSLSTTHYANVPWMQSINLPAGFHTVQDYFYSDGNALVGSISIAYRLYGTG